ncbi:M23 family metallopeptidase [Trichothermofontia sp.]
MKKPLILLASLACLLTLVVSCQGARLNRAAADGSAATPTATTIAAENTTQIAAATEIATPYDGFRLSLPINCKIGDPCFVLLYPDRDPGPGAIDVGCGRLTYDGHDGTDFAIPDMHTRVTVVAAAPGQVLRTRDGVVDRRVEGDTDKAAIAGMECGNGIVIQHADGWETQYCHLRQGSVLVKPGDEVQAGTPLGLVGMSGMASFPHVHLSVRHRSQAVDPFVGPDAGAGCQVERRPLWQPTLPYQPTGLVRAGFSTRPPEIQEVWDGEFSDTRLATTVPTLIFWVQSYGLDVGDVEEMRLLDPNGKVVVHNQKTRDRANRIYLSYVGKRVRPEAPLQAGIWRGEYRLTRQGKVLIEVNRTLTVTA